MGKFISASGHTAVKRDKKKYLNGGFFVFLWHFNSKAEIKIAAWILLKDIKQNEGMLGGCFKCSVCTMVA